MYRFAILFLSLLVTVPFMTPALYAATGETVFRLQTEAELTLSIAQEAEEAIDRAQRWLNAQPPATNRVDALLQRYALTAPDAPPFKLYRCDITPLEHAMPPPETTSAITNLTAFLEEHAGDMKRLFALQRDLPLDNPPDNWRETITLAIINTQRITSTGGYWPDKSRQPTRLNTLWAILSLRALLNESPRVELAH